MKVLLHICCGPCAIMPIRSLLDEGCAVEGLFYNPNIHPLSEYLRRREGALQVAERYGIKLHCFLQPWEAKEKAPAKPGAHFKGSADYDPEAWLRSVLPAMRGNPEARCPLCWKTRLETTQQQALTGGYDAFSSSLLYSRWQKHETIAALGEQAACHGGPGAPAFLYRDFRVFWQEGIAISKEWGIYRQQYCGCLFSESDRYAGEKEKADHALQGMLSGVQSMK